MLENSHYKRVVAVAIALIFVGFSTIKAQDLLYESGPLYNETGEPNKSILQDMLGMTTLGFASLNSSGYRIADKFTLNTHSSIQKFDFFAYQTGYSGMLSINEVRIQIYNGEPGEGGTVVIWGDQTNRYSVSTVESGYRVSESNPNNSDRQIQKISANTTGLELDAGTYWVEFSLDSSIRPFETIWAPPITINEEASTGNAIQFTGTTYQPLIDSGTQTPQGIPFHVYGTPNFPTPYCVVSDLYNVEPITRVLITEAGIDNSSSESSILKHEDFTNIVGTMQQGETYESAVEGFTDGPYINSIHIYIDWDQDGTFTGADEYFNGGTIHNSIGSEAEQAIGSIEVPVNALEGETRMRIIKTYDIVIPNPNNGCTGGSNYGQIEDYTINVIPNENMGISDLSSFDFAYYPNPVKDVLNITSQKAVESVSAFNLTGQKVMNNAKVNNGQIDVSNLVDGTYVFRVTLEDGSVETFKVIKK